MNLFKRFFAWFFRRQYVLLIWHDNDMRLKHACKLGGIWYANAYGPDHRCELIPGGKINGQSYVNGWRPITKNMFLHYATNRQLES